MKTIDQFLAHLYRLDVKLWLEADSQTVTNQFRLRCSAPEQVLTPSLSSELQERKAEIIAFLQTVKLAHHSTAKIPVAPRSGHLPLSFAQQRLWFLEQLQPGSGIYNIPIAVRLTGSLHVAAFEQSLNEMIHRHEIFRTHFRVADGQPVQVIVEPQWRSFPVTDLQSLSQAQQDAEVRQLALQEAQMPFDLAQDALLRVKLLRLHETEHIMLITLHHIISDGWSIEVLIREWVTLYAAASAGKPALLPDLPIQYADFAVWQRQWLQGEVLAAQLSYWKQQLGGVLPVLQLPTDFPRARVQTFRGGVETFSLAGLSQPLKTLAQRQGVTLFMLLLAAYQVLLYRYTGQTDLIVGSPIANRNRTELEGLIGFFVNTLVLRTDLSGNPTFRDVLQQVRQVTWAAYDHQDLPFEKLVEELHPERDLSYNPLFQVKFRLENTPAESRQIPGLAIDLLQQVNPTAKLDLSLDLYETASGLVGGFEYNRDLFSSETVLRFVNHFQTLLAGIVEQPNQRIGELPLLTVSEQQQILVDWNQTQADYANWCFHQRFEAQVAQTPDAVALIFNDKQLTYRELNQRSNQLAHYLQKLGVRPETIVGLSVNRSPDLIIGLLAILKAGGAYLPLDPAYPPERLGFMLTDSQASILITRSDTPHTLHLTSHSHLIYLDTDWHTIAQEPDQNPISAVQPANLAYLIYTSGSTGIPKGVLVNHAGLVNLTEDKIRVCAVQPNSCILQFFSLSFDASIPEIVMALGCGAKLCLAPLASLLPGAALLQLLRQHAITHITLTPSALSALPVEALPALQMVLVGGEAPSAELISRWSEKRRFINAYGPTEVTVNASMVECGNEFSLLPTLRPSANKQFYILDSNLRPVPVGVIGELHIGGIGLARGYLNRPDLTAARFIPNPFTLSPLHSLTSSRLYKTGDLACYLPDGRIKLLGRIDNQVKIRGFRIEPGEIEALLAQHPAVQTSAVVVREDSPGDKRLVAYVVKAGGTAPSANDLRRFLKEKLPDYMVPSVLVLLDALPLTPNGKVDHQSLPFPEVSQRADAPIIAPQTSTEATLLEIFQDILQVTQISIDDDFFELGGHSLLATRLIAQALQTFQVELSVADLFAAPTITELAERIDTQQTVQTLRSSPDPNLDREEIEL